jgi:hypothetical protein
MNSSSSLSLSLTAKRSNLPLTVALLTGVSVILGLYFTDSSEAMLAYVLVTFVCTVPIVMWVWNGALGIPIIPAMGGMYFVYYGIPIIRNRSSLANFDPSEILRGGGTVALFLSCAVFMWWLAAGNVHRANDDSPSLISGSWLKRIILAGLVCGMIFHISVFVPGLLWWMGPAFGLFRSAMLSFAISACFMLGHARALGTLRKKEWRIALACLSIIVMFALLSLFLVGAMVYCLAAVLGYVVTGKRVPWIFLSAALVFVIILHAGKDAMREKYWSQGVNYSTGITALDAPEILFEWVEGGVTKVLSGDDYRSAVDRASLFALLLQVQRLTPDYIPHLDGASYALLPEMLVPRFLDPDKINSQAAMTLLNVSAGFQDVQSAAKTSIGWGLLAEAYFNFGYLGVVGIGLIFGGICGLLQRRTIGVPLFSLPCLIALSVLMQLITMELDAAGLVTAAFQSVVAVSSVYWLIKTLANRKRTQRRVAVDY